MPLNLTGESTFIVSRLEGKEVPFRFKQRNTCDEKEGLARRCLRKLVRHTNGGSSAIVVSKSQRRPF
jgi:hypothetical protein